MNEEFKEINYKGAKILVSKNGKVIHRGKERPHRINHDGYIVCSIKIDDGWRSVAVHRLVAMAYIPNPDNLPEVNHKDFDRANCNVDNLEWITHEENVKYSLCNRPDYWGKNNPNYGNHKLSQIYRANPKLALEKQSRKGIKNGRCRKIRLFYDNVLVKQFDYIGDCCEYLIDKYKMNIQIDSLRGQIRQSIKYNKPYKQHFTFQKLT